MESIWIFLQMDGYGVFVWPSYFLAVLLLVANGWAARQRRRRALLQLAHAITQQSQINSTTDTSEAHNESTESETKS